MTNSYWKTKFQNRLLLFSSSVIKLTNQLPKTPAGYAIASQLVRSACSVGANFIEAQDASSTKDFYNRLQISLREARETLYWIQVIEVSSLISSSELTKLKNEANEIIAILVSISKKMKAKK